MRLILVRHGQTDWNLKHLMQGMTDIPLNETGKMQAFNAKEKLKNVKLDICFSSPLSSAIETAKIITGLDIIIDKRIIERSAGSLEGKDSELYRKHNYYDFKLNSNEYGVETAKDLFARASDFLNDIKEKYSDKTVLVVSHGATIRALHYIITGYDEKTNFLEMKIPNCSILEYEI